MIKKIVFKTPEAMIAGDLSNFIGFLSRVDLLPGAFRSKCIFLQNHTLSSYPAN